MPYGLDPSGRPLFLISAMAMHTQNILADPRASLLVTQAEAAADPLGAGRVTLMGKVTAIPEPELPEARELYLAGYENARYWADFDDFAFYRMEIVDVYFVGGFGVMGWVAASEYGAAHPDPLADAMNGILEHMNSDHRDSLVLLARSFAGIEAKEAAMTSVDRLGFQVRLSTEEGVRGARIPFLREASSPAEVRSVLIEMVDQAR
jgi:putative heme iron utilization protein